MTSIVHGVIIDQRDYKETDRVYTLYTKERGKIRVLGKGTRKFHSKLAAHMMPFAEVQLMLAHGKMWLKLASVERLHDFSPVRQDIHQYGLAVSLNELIHRSVGEHEPDEGLYQFLLNAYAWIQTLPELSPERYQFVQSALVLKGLVMLGFGPHCDACIGCHDTLHEIEAPCITTAHGGLVCTRCVEHDKTRFTDAEPFSHELIAALRFMTSAPFEELLNRGAEPLLSTLTDVQDRFVYYHLERPLRVPTFITHLVTA